MLAGMKIAKTNLLAEQETLKYIDAILIFC